MSMQPAELLERLSESGIPRMDNLGISVTETTPMMGRPDNLSNQLVAELPAMAQVEPAGSNYLPPTLKPPEYS